MTPPPDLLALDTAHREQAIDPTTSYLIEAPAGAGKTELLTQRFLALLARVEEPEEVVALTFTNKAAAEMRDRIVQSLQRAANSEVPGEPHKQMTHRLAQAVLAHDQRRQWGLLDHASRLQITTLDALCGQLVRQMPLLSRFGSQPGIALDPTPHYEQAARETLSLLETDHPIADALWRVLDRFDNDSTRLQAQLVAMLAQRDQWLHHSRQGIDLAAAEAALGDLIADGLARVAEVLTPSVQSKLMPIVRFAASQVITARNAGEPLPGWASLEALADWTEPLRPHVDDLPRWRALPPFLLTQKGELRAGPPNKMGFSTPAGKALGNDCKALLQQLKEANAGPLLQSIDTFPDPVYTAAERALIGDLLAVLKVASAQLWLAFQQAREVDFTEMAQNALLALGDEAAPSELQLRLDYRISHLLVDEFQDTSPTQVELLQRLTAGWQPGDGRTLFLVGDPMQSIYKFRKADVGLFLKVRERGLGHLRLRALHLYRNNRSHSAVVDWVNSTFPRVFAERDDHHRGAVRFTRAAATRGPHPQARVCWHPVIDGVATETDAADEADTDTAAREAQAIIGIIQQTRAQDPKGSIAVLVRARKHLQALVAALRSTQPALPFQAVEIEPLAERQLIQDLISLTRALNHLGDRTHWLAMLRAPWCGLTLHDLHRLAADDHARPVWSLMSEPDRCARLSEDGQQRLAHVRSVIGEALAHQGQQRPRRWIEGVWQALGGPWCLKHPAERLDALAFFDALDRCDRQGLLDLSRLEREVGQLYAAPDPDTPGAIQLMTIHKSKGLEFDTVILPGLHRKAPAIDRPLLLWDEVLDDAGQERLVVAAQPSAREASEETPSIFSFLQAFEAERAQHEARRLLYVAVTRARRQLHLLGAAARDAKQPEAVKPPPKDSLLALLWHDAAPWFVQRLALASTETASDVDSPPDTPPRPGLADYAHRLERLAHVAWPPALLHDVPMSAAASDAEEPAPSTAPTGDAALAIDIGRLVHRYLEIMAEDGLAHWPEDRVQALLPAMTHWLQTQGHATSAAQAGAAETLAQLITTLRSPQGQWVLGRHAEAASEWPVTTWEEGRARLHVIDRTFVDQGVRWIIDYKTTRHDEPDAAAYREQLERYRRLFSEGPPVRLGIFFTFRGELHQLED